ncbi:MFS transporter [Streptacidiphilus pinicola]|uniref:MFS transporter n=1 Tax=Streptacidiphilus pinicola TaxID=2219663 RepID=A0A2X0IE74_9ACTN|nr:MFS transporter [Streptacidiphilus pinicola]RAG83302.1 MFS transporter [Streptacidiphilus pinicola]
MAPKDASLSRGNYVRYMLGMAVDSLGSGMYLPLSLLYFHRVTGIPLVQVGALLTVAAVAGLVANPFGGALVDRYGAKAVTLATYAVRAVGFGAYALVDNRVEVLAAATLVAFGDQVSPPASQALVASITRGGGRDKLIAAQRGLRNAGLGAGGLIAGATVAAGTLGAYRTIVLADAASFVLVAVLVAGIPIVHTGTAARRARPGRGGYREVFKDRPFTLLTCVNLPTALGYKVLSVILPLYLTQRMGLSASWVGVNFAINTALIALFQVPVTHLLRNTRRTRATALAGAVFALSFVVYAASGALHGETAALSGLFTGTVLFSFGELMHGATSTALAASAAPESLRGRYLSFYQFSWAIPAALAPVLLSALLSASPLALWIVLAVGTGGAGLALLPLEPRLPREAVYPEPPATEPPATEPPATESPATATKTTGETAATPKTA